MKAEQREKRELQDRLDELEKSSQRFRSLEEKVGLSTIPNWEKTWDFGRKSIDFLWTLRPREVVFQAFWEKLGFSKPKTVVVLNTTVCV